MDDALQRRMRAIADRIGKLLRRDRQLPRIGQELPRDRIGGIGGIDQRRHLRRDGNSKARGDAGDLGLALGRNEPRRDELLRPAQRGFGHADALKYPRSTWSRPCRPDG